MISKKQEALNALYELRKKLHVAFGILPIDLSQTLENIRNYIKDQPEKEGGV